MTPDTISNKKLELINRTRNVLRGERKDSQELKKLYKELEEWDQFAYATDVLLAKMKQDEKEGNPVSLKEHQTLAKFIYKDHSLPSSFKFDKAIQHLNAHDELTRTDKCETLGLAGAIYKYKWLYDHQPGNLDRSLNYYKRGYESWRSYLNLSLAERETRKYLNDDGYTAINYAYVLELQAIDELEAMGNNFDMSKPVEAKLEQARAVRSFILDEFLLDRKEPKEKEYESWVYATIAEALVGLRQYEIAISFIHRYREREKKDIEKESQGTPVEEKVVAWKIRTFSRQMFSIAYCQHSLINWLNSSGGKSPITKLTKSIEGIDETKLAKCLVALTTTPDDGVRHAAVEVAREGKLGLALSGGGFRASIYHIGVLAALAEYNVLKDIEVLSCVSGGSIIGAFYYLKLKNLLERKSDQDVTQEDYVNLIKELEEQFLGSVQKNLRMRVLSNVWCNLKMIFSNSYSRTHRLGELYEEYLYGPLWKNHTDTIYINDLLIKPSGEAGFSISTDNWKRKNKVPQLILNATTVNTGHNWQFTASWMGEPPGSIQTDIDVKPRLRRMYYDDAPEKFKKFRLGYAVGASSCVPVLFEPIPMNGLYPNLRMQLVDGGLHDNQGIASLIEQECKNMIISDASGQMSTETKAQENELSLFMRADLILQERLRELQFKDLKERVYSSQLNSLTTIHLKSNLQKRPLSWEECTDPPRVVYEEEISEDPNELTPYGVVKRVQEMLSEIRTDLDSFHDTEAYALMYSAYMQTRYALNKRKSTSPSATPTEWKFLKIHKQVTEPEEIKKVQHLFKVASKVPFKVLQVSSIAKLLTVILGLLMLTPAIYFIWLCWNKEIGSFTVGGVVLALIILIVSLLSKELDWLLNIRSKVRKYIGLTIIAVISCIVSNVYLLIYNGLYNRAGRVE